MKVIIRAVSPKDISEICKVHHASVQGLKEGLYPKKMIRDWASSVSCKALKEVLYRPETIGFVAKFAGTTIGFAAIQQRTVRAMYVHPDYQGQGIGSMLLDRLEAAAARKGIHRLILNAPLNAGSFYESRGYHMMGEMPFAFNKSVILPSLEMAKDIM